MLVNSDLSDLLSLFNARNVRYLIIVGYAVILYAEPSRMGERMPNSRRLDLCLVGLADGCD